MKDEKIVIERTYDAPIERVWTALTDANQMRQWYFPLMESFEPQEGFETQFDVAHNGNVYPHIWKVTEAIPLKKIAYSWRYGGYPGNSVVSFELESVGSKTKLTLTHLFTESFESGKFADFSRENFSGGWTSFAEKLKNFVES